MSTIRFGGTEVPVPKSMREVAGLVADLNESHPGLRETVLLYALVPNYPDSAVSVFRPKEGAYEMLHFLFEVLGRPDFKRVGYVRRSLSPQEVDALLAVSSPMFDRSSGDSAPALLTGLCRENRDLTGVILNKECGDQDAREDYLRERTRLLFDGFNEGTLRGADPGARQALLDSFCFLPNRFLDAAGYFIGPDDVAVPRKLSDPTCAVYPDAIDKFPSLVSVRAKRLRDDQNRIVPGAMIRNGVHVGKRNIFMFHAAVNIAASLGDDNLIDSHASIGSAAQIGNRNKIASFVSLEGVLSPANAEPVTIGDDNFLGSYVRVGTGIRLGNHNFIGSGVNIALGTKLRDCRLKSPTRGAYITPRDLNQNFNDLALAPNNAEREFNQVNLRPGEFIVFDNTDGFMERFTEDHRIKAK